MSTRIEIRRRIREILKDKLGFDADDQIEIIETSSGTGLSFNWEAHFPMPKRRDENFMRARDRAIDDAVEAVRLEMPTLTDD